MQNVRQFPNMNAIKDEAAVWVVRMHGCTYKSEQSLPDDMAAELHEWMNQSPLHRKTLLKALGNWDAMGMLEELADILPIAEIQHQHDMVGFPLVPQWLRDFFVSISPRESMLAFSGSAAAFCVIAFMVVAMFLPQGEKYVTQIGEQSSHALSDGSVITLNTDSELHVDFSGEMRVVKLIRGEANFEVAKDKARPFVVYAGDGMVWAVGTAFNVYSQNGLVDVIVSEGTVKVFSGVTLRDKEPLLMIDDGKGYIGEDDKSLAQLRQDEYFREVVLDAGESAQYSKSRVVKEVVEAEELEKDLAWQSGILVFHGETLSQALEKISRYTDRKLVIVDPIIADVNVGGRFQMNDIPALVDSLSLGLDIAVEYGQDDSILFSAK
jgi:transmembrane sensor